MGNSAARLILLADRGFGCTELAETCQRLGFRHVIRIKPDVYVEGPTYCDNRQHVVIRWKQGLPKKRDEPWFLLPARG